MYGIPEKIKSDKGGAFVSKEYPEFCKNRNIGNLENGISLTESVTRALHEMRFTIHTELKLTPFELHHGRKPRTELTNIVKDEKSVLSSLSELSVSAPNRPKTPIYVAVMRTGTSQTISLWREPKQRRNTSPKEQNHRRRKFWLDIPSTLLKRNIIKNNWKENFKGKYKPQ